MITKRMKRFGILPILFVMGSAPAPSSPEKQAAATPDWRQWGGPSRDFKSDVKGLADRWPADGPKRLWRRPLGDGYSSVVGDRDRIYTMYRDGPDEIIIAMHADTGKTIWEHRCDAVPNESQSEEFGQGPAATPLLLNDRIITVGFTGLLHCLDLEKGSTLWSYDLVKQFDGKLHYWGYANSPIEYKGKVLVLVGGEKYGVFAFDPASGKPAWKGPACDPSYAAPILINVDGQDQLVFFTTDKVMGIDPRNGASLWSHPVVNNCRVNCTSAIWGQDNLLWAATKGVGGTRVLKLKQQDGKTRVTEIWRNDKITIFHWNALRIGDFVYTSIGGAQKFLAVIDVRTGEIVDKQRGLGGANGVYADGKLVLLGDSGTLALAEPSPQGIKTRSSTKLFDSVTWTPPTLLDKTLYVRDRQHLMALDLGADLVTAIAP